MADQTLIEWADATHNPWIGCSKKHAGCANCYAERDAGIRRGLAAWGKNGTRVLMSRENWAKPFLWDRKAKKAGRPTLVFCASLADVFEDWQEPMMLRTGGNDPRKIAVAGKCASCKRIAPYNGSALSASAICPVCAGRVFRYMMNDARDDLFSVIDATPNLIWLVLTKRPENIRSMWPEIQSESPIFPGMPGPLGDLMPCSVRGARRGNVFLGTSPCNRWTANESVPHLIKAAGLAGGTFLSGEPLLGDIDMIEAGAIERDSAGGESGAQGVCFSRGVIDWVIVGGESGPNARPCNLSHVLSVVSQCKAAGVPVFVKQLGAIVRAGAITGSDLGWRLIDDRLGVGFCDWKLRHHKGADPSEWPESLRVQQFPECFQRGGGDGSP